MTVSAKNIANRILLGTLALVATSVWAAQNPIGALSVEGKATVNAKGSSFTLRDEGYAYFSDDVVRTGQGSRAVLLANDGIKVVFGESSVGEISYSEGLYKVDVRKGQIAVDAEPGVEFQLFNNGAPVARGNPSTADGVFLVNAIPNGGGVKSYTPAALTQTQIESLEESEVFTDEQLKCLIEKTEEVPQAELQNMSVEQLAEYIDCEQVAAAPLTGKQAAVLAVVLGATVVIVADDNGSGS